MKRMVFSPHGRLYVQYQESDLNHDMPVQHYHDAYEIYFQTEGKRYLFWDNVCYTLVAGDAAVFSPFDLHYAESRDSGHYGRYVMNFQPEIFSSILEKQEEEILLRRLYPCVIHIPEHRWGDLLGDFKRAEECAQREGFLAEKMAASAVLHLVMRVQEYMGNSFMVQGKQIPGSIIKALTYVEKHYKRRLTLDEIASESGMSKYYFCRLFQKVTGATVLEYIRNIRLRRVHDMLLHTEDTLEAIAGETGFASAADLARVFKKVYGAAPREFRKQHRNLCGKAAEQN